MPKNMTPARKPPTFRIMALSLDGVFDTRPGDGPSAIISGSFDDLRSLPLGDFVTLAAPKKAKKRPAKAKKAGMK